MHQVKCNQCQFTKFFVNAVGGTTMISCSECGASFVLGTPEPVQEEQIEEPKQEFVEEPEEIHESKIVKTPQETVQQSKPSAVKMTPEQKKALLKEMEEGGEYFGSKIKLASTNTFVYLWFSFSLCFHQLLWCSNGVSRNCFWNSCSRYFCLLQLGNCDKEF